MTNGSVTLNGLTDKQLVTVLEAKIRHEGAINFNPQLIQQAQTNPQKPGVLINNNVVINWANEVGFKAAIELQAELLNHRLVAKDSA